MSKIQITQALFGALIKFHLLDREEEGETIKEELTTKLDSLVKHDIYTKYKMAETTVKREKARQEYLDRIGLRKGFRW